MKKYYFISGLPRSGSTLLSSILKQNPRFTASISDPLYSYVKNIITSTNTAVGMSELVNTQKQQQLMRGIFDSYYRNDNPVCFNTNRSWTSDTSLLNDLYPDFRMIVCIRDISWILDSFEQLHNKNPYTIKPIYNHQDLNNVYARSHMLMGNMNGFTGYVSTPLDNVRHSMFCNERNQLLFVEYDHLVKYPEYVMKQIYQFLGENYFNHDYDNVEDSYDEFDEKAKIVGLHKVRKKVQWIERRSILPPDLWNLYDEKTFWKRNFESHKLQLNWSVVPSFNSMPVKTVKGISKQL